MVARHPPFFRYHMGCRNKQCPQSVFLVETGHAIALSDQIDFLGGVLAVDVEKMGTSSDRTEMLEQDLAGECHAISRYEERIAEAESLRESGLRRVLEDILIVEKKYARDLLTALGR